MSIIRIGKRNPRVYRKSGWSIKQVMKAGSIDSRKRCFTVLTGEGVGM